MDRKFSGISDVLRSLGDLVDGLATVTQDGVWSAGGEVADERTGTKAVYGVSVRVGRRGDTRTERFGTVRSSAVGAAGAAVAEDVREPIIDLFDEGDSLRLVAEMPGVEVEDVRYEVSGRRLTLKADRGDRHYTKDVDLPVETRAPLGAASYRNGIFEIALRKAVGLAGR
jgi:HSP20 family protein